MSNSQTLKKEIAHILEISLEEVTNTNLEDYLYALLNQTHMDILALRLIYKFKIDFSERTKKILCSFILTLLHHPEMCKQSHLAELTPPEEILADLIMDVLNHQHHIVLDFIKYVDQLRIDEYKHLFIAVIQVFSYRSSNSSIFEDFMKFVDPLLNLIELKSVQDAMITPNLWLVRDYKSKNRIYPFANSIYSSLRKYNRSFFYGFLEIFIYCEIKYDRFSKFKSNTPLSSGRIMELKYEIDTKTTLFHDTLYAFVLKLFHKKKETKNLFQRFLINVIQVNADRAKLKFDERSVDIDGVVFNLSGMLTRFCNKIISIELSELINPAFLFVFDDPLIDSNIKIKDNDSKKSFTSCIFFSKLKFMQLSVLKIINDIKQNNNAIYNFEQALLTDNVTELPESRRRDLKKFLALAKAANTAYNLIMASTLVQHDTIFIEFVNSYLIEVFGKELPEFYYLTRESINELSDLKIESETKKVVCSVKTFPEYIYNILFFLHISFKKLTKSFMFLAAQIFNTELPNVSFKSYLIQAFDDRHDIELIPDIFLGFIKYYVELDKLDDFNFDRTNTRTAIINVLNYDSSNKIYSLNTKNSFHLKFLHSFLSDIKKNISSGLTAIKDIRDFYLNKDRYTPETLEEKMRKIARDENLAKYSFKQLNIFLKFLHRLIKSCAHNIFANRLIITTFVGILNCNLKIIVGPSCSSLRVSDKEKYNFEPRTILFLLINIYLIMDERCTIVPEKPEDLLLMDRNDFIEHIISDSIYFSVDLFFKSYEICRRKAILGEQELNQLKKFVAKLNNLYLEKTANKNENKEEIEIPDEFIDPLTFAVMENPVKLLTSGKVVDMETYEMLMLGDCLDPFNRELLSKEKICEETELKERIEEWNKKFQ